MDYKIVYCSEELVPSFRECLDSVAKEKRFLFITEAAPVDQMIDFIRDNIKHNVAQYFAIDSNEKVIGWCDIRRLGHHSRAHVGELGMGILSSYRGQGIGKDLLNKCLQHSKKDGLEKVELEVYGTNKAAIEIYQKNGFKIVGTREKFRKIDNHYDSCVLMEMFLGH